MKLTDIPAEWVAPREGDRSVDDRDGGARPAALAPDAHRHWRNGSVAMNDQHSFQYLLSMAEGTDHGAPAEEFTIPQAHQATQAHVGCRAWACPRKAAAVGCLIDAGRLVPSRRGYEG